MSELKPGDRAPDFNLQDQDGARAALSDFRGRKLLLYFYPKADTPGCTAQACSVQKALLDLAGFGIDAVGISPDPSDRQRMFARKHKLSFRLLSDPLHQVAAAYGAWGEKSMYGKKFEGIPRSSFLIGGDGRIIRAWDKVSPKDTVPLAREALG
jgi:thioredoxin-dependent peroxiredoxin